MPTPQKVLGFVTYNPENGVDKQQLMETVGKSLESYKGFSKAHMYSQAQYGGFRSYEDIVTNISVRDDYLRSDYEYFRPGEKIPKDPQMIIAYCIEAYRKVGIVRNVIDLMADFAVKGIELVHPNPQVQKFYRGWFKKVKGVDRSERFLSLLYKAGNVPIKKVFGKINQKYKDYLVSLAQSDAEFYPDIKVEVENNPPVKTIPIRYDILNPLSVMPTAGEIAQFVGKSIYVIKLSSNVIQKILAPSTPEEKEIVGEIPSDILMRIRSGATTIPLPSDKFRMFFYKKDDWQTFGEPMVYAIFDSLILLEKMQLADLAALDGAISQIRLWKLGNIEAGIFPTEAAINKLSDILMSNPGGGAFDLIWGPELSVEEYKTSVHQFLGKAKYEPVLESIYSGLGVPPTLTGSANAAGTTNNYVSLKTLTERLEYGRRVLTSFWDEEIRLVQKAMGFRFPAEVRFDSMVLADEVAEKALLIQLIDRDLISAETLAERFGESDELEVLRMRREKREKEKSMRVERGGPFKTADKEFELAKVALGRVLMSPHEAGIDVVEQYKDPPFIMQLKSAEKAKAMGGASNLPPSSNKGGTGGRPRTSRDSTQRQRTFKIRTSADTVDSISEVMATMNWAKAAQSKISDILLPAFLQKYNKKDIRGLTTEQVDSFESLKFYILSCINPFDEIDEKLVGEIINNDIDMDEQMFSLCNQLIGESRKIKGDDLTMDELRNIKSMSYALMV